LQLLSVPVVLLAAFLCAAMAGAWSSSFPPPGRIVYSVATPSLGPDSHSLFTAAADGTGARQITTNAAGWDADARWSPGGTQVAFTRVAPGRNLTSVWVVNADGTDAQPVSGGPSFAEHPKWSPDGRWIAYQEQTAWGSTGSRDDSSYDLWLVRPDGSDLKELETGGVFGSSELYVGYGSAWAWSPDSKQIVYTYGSESDSESRPKINVLNLSTGSKRRLTSGSYPVWSPDGRRLAFVDRCRIWVMPPKGGNRTPLTPRSRPKSGECVSQLGWSPDGRWIAATAGDGNIGYPIVARSDGKQQHRARLIRPATVRWPRDCKRMFFYPVPEWDWVGWIVHGPQGIPRFARVPARSIIQTYADWRC
jgi:Tol biopolymer transport system component